MTFDAWFRSLMSDENDEIVSGYEPEDFARAAWDFLEVEVKELEVLIVEIERCDWEALEQAMGRKLADRVILKAQDIVKARTSALHGEAPTGGSPT